jgi:hypothetical protein
VEVDTRGPRDGRQRPIQCVALRNCDASSVHCSTQSAHWREGTLAMQLGSASPPHMSLYPAVNHQGHICTQYLDRGSTTYQSELVNLHVNRNAPGFSNALSDDSKAKISLPWQWGSSVEPPPANHTQAIHNRIWNAWTPCNNSAICNALRE